MLTISYGHTLERHDRFLGLPPGWRFQVADDYEEMGRKGYSKKTRYEMKVDTGIEGVVSVAQMAGEDDEETAQLRTMLQEARDYIKSFRWCLGIQEEFFGLGIGGVIGVFLRVTFLRDELLPALDDSLHHTNQSNATTSQH